MTYRADIDGLRSIAVLLVILFHFGIGYFPGGYVGVDVFFVLSGFLISSQIFKDLDADRFSFSEFYFRRIKRLAPVYFVVMLVSSIVAYLVMLPGDFKEFGQSLLASSMYLSNILFYMETGYFDTASHLKPLLHTWSLSVEEQFYIVFPLLAIFLFKLGRKAVLPGIVILSLASLIAAEAYIQKDQSAVFYLYPFRAWEMFLGSLLALRRVPIPQGKLAANGLSILGMTAIVYSAMFYEKSTIFPGLSALLPCLGTVALIVSGYGNGIVNSVLSTRIPVFIGKLSYSLYLWHWPLFVFYSYYYQEDPAGVSRYVLMLATFVLSYISWKFIETPFRSGKFTFYRGKASVFGSTVVITSFCIVFGLWLHKTNGVESRLSHEEKSFAKAAVLFEQTGTCLLYDNEKLPGISHCAIGNPYSGDEYSILWGDSHAGAYVAPFRHGLKNTNANVLIAWAGGCPPVLGIYKKENFASARENSNCQKHSDAVIDLIRGDLDKIKTVVIAGRWSYYLNGRGVGRDAHNEIEIRDFDDAEYESKDDQEKLFLISLERTLKTIAELGVKVFFIEQPPEIEDFHARTLAVKLKTSQKSMNEIHRDLAVVEIDSVNSRQGSVVDLASRLEDERVIEVLYTHKHLCDSSKCSAIVEGEPVYFDNNHITASSSEITSPMFSKAIRVMSE